MFPPGDMTELLTSNPLFTPAALPTRIPRRSCS
jgi:hypothetical protein